MLFLLRLAFVNLFRQYRRTALSMVSVIAGVWVIIIGRGFTEGVKENLARASIDSYSGHVLVQPAAYPETGVQAPVDDLFKVGPELRAWLDTHTVAWTQRTWFSPRAIRGSDATRVRAISYDPLTDEAVFPRKDWRIDGVMPASRADGVLASTGVARILGLKTGDRLVLEVRTTDGALNAMDYPVAGVLTTGNPLLDSMVILVPDDLTEELVQKHGACSHLSLRISDRDDADATAGVLKGVAGTGVRVKTWLEVAEPMMKTQEMRQTFTDFIGLALMAMAATGIANTILMAAFERVREIGTLQALGMTRAGVVGLFVGEGFFIGLVGSLVGGLVAGWQIWGWSVHGFDISTLMEAKKSAMDNIPFTMLVYMPFSKLTIAVSMAVGVLVAMLASIYPALVASRQAPADAVRAP